MRAIFGALENPIPLSTTPDTSRLQSEEEVEASFDVTSSKPVRLQIIFYRDSTKVPVVPDPPLHQTMVTYYPMDFLDTPEVYEDPAEDSGALRWDGRSLVWLSGPSRELMKDLREGRTMSGRESGSRGGL